MKIRWQEIFTETIPFTRESDVVWRGVNQWIERAKSPATQVDQAWLPRSSDMNWYPYLEMLNDVEIVNQLKEAEKDGSDAAIIGCYCDPGLREARGILNIPVVGLSEASMILAQTLGGRFACVTVWDSYVPIMEKNLRLYGWESRAIANRPVRYFDLEWPKLVAAFKGDGDSLIKDFERVALSCVEDGADVIIAGCGYLAPALSLCGYTHIAETKVPVVDCVAAGVAMAEAMARLYRNMGVSPSRSATSPYPHPPQKKFLDICERFGLNNVAEDKC